MLVTFIWLIIGITVAIIYHWKFTKSKKYPLLLWPYEHPYRSSLENAGLIFPTLLWPIWLIIIIIKTVIFVHLNINKWLKIIQGF